MKSMTGFGVARLSASPSKKGPAPTCDLDAQVRSVNGRFLEIKVSLPHEYLPFESELRQLIQNKLKRGSVSLYVARRPHEKLQGLDVRVKSAYAKKWLSGYKKLGAELGLKSEPDLNFIARLPDVIQVVESNAVSTAEKKSLLETVEQAVTACDEARVREGQALAKECLKQIAALSKNIDQLQAWRKDADAIVRTAFKEKLTRLGFDDKIHHERMGHEIALIIDKADVQEELVRLREHVANVTDLVKSRESQGKKLDFYVQELLREINTVGSKTSVSKMTSAVVDSKTIIEKLREQVQNIE